MNRFLDILGTQYELIFTDDLPDGILGLCDSGSKTIRVHAGLTGKSLLHTLLHEFIHACDFENGFYQAVGAQIMEVTAETHARALLNNFDIKPKKPGRKEKKKTSR